jgi:HEAT repeat protein
VETEPQALDVLKSAAPAAAKEAACLRLKQIGTAQSVPALKALIADESLAQWAVDALQTMPAREAGEALVQALPETSGKAKALVIFAFGTRRETAAIQPLTKLVSDPDAIVAVATAKALGKIGDAISIAALRAAKPGAPGNVRTAINDALLACAERLLDAGDATTAAAVYGSLRVAAEADQVRTAAFRGAVLCAANHKGSLLLEALIAGVPAEQAMAIQLARELPDSEVTSTLAGSLARTGPLVQVALLEALSQRNDPAAAKEIATLTRASEASVRSAVIKALGQLGDASHVGLLAELAATAAPAERSEARLALVTLHRGQVLEAILTEIHKAPGETRIELTQTLARRMDRGAVPQLLRLASESDAKLGIAAIQALEKLADDSHMSPLLGLITGATDDARRAAAVSAFAAVGARGRHAAEFSSGALKSLAGATPEIRCALLEGAGSLGGPGVLDALRAALKDPDANVRVTALRTMAENSGDEARPDLLKLAQESPAEPDRALALRGYWRLVEAMNERPQVDRFVAVRAGLAATKSAADQKLGLARLAELRGEQALELAQRYRRDPAVRPEAEAAILQIATRLDATQLATAEATLRGLAAGAENQRVRSEAGAFVTKLEAQAGYIAPWLVSGPYRQPGKEAQQLFDIAFAPESQGAGEAKWRPLNSATSLTNYWFADLAPVVGGNHCVVYLETRVFCPKEQPVALEIGSDDGAKLWINGALVHANNAVRGFTAGEDKAKGALKEGWNEFLVKITQHTAGCAAAVRVRDADGKLIPGLRVEAKE